jgi:hypothetical protein
LDAEIAALCAPLAEDRAGSTGEADSRVELAHPTPYRGDAPDGDREKAVSKAFND